MLCLGERCGRVELRPLAISGCRHGECDSPAGGNLRVRVGGAPHQVESPEPLGQTVVPAAVEGVDERGVGERPALERPVVPAPRDRQRTLERRLRAVVVTLDEPGEPPLLDEQPTFLAGVGRREGETTCGQLLGIRVAEPQ